MSKKILMIMLAVSLTASCGITVSAAEEQQETAEEQQETAEESSGYQKGDTMDDFSITLMDGSETSLYKLLEGKKAIVLNFWATWCGPCQEEFPYLEEIYKEVSDEIGFVALDIDENTEEEISEFRDSFGISELPMGIDKGQELQKKFGVEAYPTTVVIDRNKVLCCSIAGAFASPSQIRELLSIYTADDYTDPVLLDEVPPEKPDKEWPSVEELTNALGITDDKIQVEIPEEDETPVWPFIISEDGTGIEASNAGKAGTSAGIIFKLDAKAGESLSYKYKTNAAYIKEGFFQKEDGEAQICTYPEEDWTEQTVIFDKDGTHEIEISFVDADTTEAEAYGMLSEVKLLSTEETAKKKEEQDKIKEENTLQTLQGDETSLEPVEFEYKNALLYLPDAPDSATEEEIFPVKQGDGAEKFRIKIGTDLDPESLVIDYQDMYYNLSRLERDEEGYIFDASAADAEYNLDTSTGKNIILLSLEDNSEKEQYTYFGSEDALDVILQVFKDYGAELNWKYVSDEEVQEIRNRQEETTESTDAEESGETEGLEVLYTAKVTDEDGNPVEGVLLQICNDVTCKVETTGKDGMVEMKMEPYAYEVHVLKAPEGYKTVNESFAMPEAGGELDITLQKE